jgi:hypothetical protein
MNNQLKTIAAIIIIFVLSGFSHRAFAQTNTGITKRVTLTKTKPCLILTGAVQSKNFDTYIFQARKGQTIIADPFYYGRETNRPKSDEEGSSGFEFIPPKGERMVDPQDIVFEAEQTGEYKIRVKPTYRRTSAKYVLKLIVKDKISDRDSELTSGKAPTCN